MLVVTKLDRLARSTAELLRISEVLNVKGAGIQSLDEPWADTTTPAGKMIMTVFGGIAEFERSLILSRTQEGREAAQARGVAFGRPGKLKSDQKNLARELVKEGQRYQRSRSHIQRTPSNDLSLHQRRSALMRVYRSAQPYVPDTIPPPAGLDPTLDGTLRTKFQQWYPSMKSDGETKMAA